MPSFPAINETHPARTYRGADGCCVHLMLAPRYMRHPMKTPVIAALLLALTTSATAEPGKWYATFEAWGSSTKSIDDPNGPPAQTNSWKGGFDTLKQCRTAAYRIACSGRPAEDIVGPLGVTRLRAYCQYRRSQPEPVYEMDDYWADGKYYSELAPGQLLEKRTPEQLKEQHDCSKRSWFSYRTKGRH